MLVKEGEESESAAGWVCEMRYDCRVKSKSGHSNMIVVDNEREFIDAAKWA